MKNVFLLVMIVISSFANAKEVKDMTQEEMIEFSNSWHPIEVSSNVGIFVKPATFAIDEIGHKVFWAKYEFYEQDITPPIRQILYVADCKHGKIGSAGYIHLDKDGNVLKEKKMPTEIAPLEYPSPDTISATLLQGICN